MGSPGSQAPAIARGHTGSLLLRLLVVAFVLNACHVPLTNAKQILSLSDDLDFMLADETSLQGINESEGQLIKDDVVEDDDFLEDDESLKSVEEDLPEKDESTPNWFSRSVHRVRRSINRLFGADDEVKAEQKQQSKRAKQNRAAAMERQKELRARYKENQNRQKQVRAERQLEKQRLAKRANNVVFNRATDPRKRASDLYDENEASGYHDDDTTFYRTYFVVSEPYSNDYRDRESDQFQNLEKLLDDDLRNFFHRNYEGNDDEEQEIHTTLERVEPTKDNFKIRVQLKIELPNSVNDFGKKLQQQLNIFNRIERLGASDDDIFSFMESTEDTVGHGGAQGVAKPRVDVSVTPSGVNTYPEVNPVTVREDFYEEPVEVALPKEEVEGSGSDDATCRGDATFTCPISGKVICDEMRCDRETQCPDGEDEEFCNYPKVCTEDQFKCDDKCLPLDRRCDRRIDCDDQTDEAGCNWPPSNEGNNDEEAPRPDEDEPLEPEPKNDPEPDTGDDEDREELQECMGNEFRCNDGKCIDASLRCNHVSDCSEGEDENEDCPAACSGMEYQCRDGTRCISVSQQCDGHSDCSDGDDEEHCDGSGYEDGECRFDEFRCGTGECIPIRQVCDNIYDCNDYTDEISCGEEVDSVGIPIGHYPPRPAPKNEDWLHEMDVHDYHVYQQSHTCESNQFRCTASNVCIPLHLRCDGYYHCNDMSDEKSCEQYQRSTSTRRPYITTPTHTFTTQGPGQLERSSTLASSTTSTTRATTEAPPRWPWSIQTTSTESTTTNLITTVGVANLHGRFNKTRLGVQCLDSQYQCGDGSCISGYKHCNGINDCADASDEYNCIYTYGDTYDDPDNNPLNECDILEFECDYSQCLPLEKKCDGYADCEDLSDELECQSYTDHCLESEFECDGYCLPRDQLCNGVTTCQDGSDERNCTFCREDAYLCNTGECVADSQRCNGIADCADSSDERHCETNNHYPTQKPSPNPIPRACRLNEWQCANLECIDFSLQCNNIKDCSDGSDEDLSVCFGTATTRLRPSDCGPDQFYCDESCYNRSVRCNGHMDCSDGSDELGCSIKSLPCPQHQCPSGRCYSETERCDRHRHCEDGSDEANCCAANQFRCNNGDCVSASAPCDGIPQCSDHSDELNCGGGHECLPNQFRCNSGQCVSSAVRCNGRTDCQDSSDEQNCAGNNNNSGRGSPQFNLKTYPDSQIIKESREVIFRCRDEGPTRAKVKWSRPGGRPLPPGCTDRNGRLEIPNIRVEDAGTYVCEAVGYASHIPGQQVTVNLNVERYNDVGSRPDTACSEYQATCMNGECIDKSGICDGTPDCSDSSDEQSCSLGLKCQPNQFMCANSKCVDRTWRCDGENDCGDNSDETSCDPEPSGAPCRYNEFQCRSGHCVPKSFQCDNVPDCADGTDEVGCMAPTPIRPPPQSVALLEYEVLELTCVATGTPTPTIVWRLNWGHVPDKCESKSYGGTGTLRCPDMRPQDSGAYSCEIINTRGTHFVTPDTIVTVTPVRTDVCEAGFFNMLARKSEECVNCFCFGVSKTCDSANLFIYAIQPPILSHRVVSVELSPGRQIVINEAAPGQDLLTLHHGVQFRASNVHFGGRETPYLALPVEYMGNQLKSYGGNLVYEVSYMGNGRPVKGPDVIITGNRFTLTHRVPTQPGQNNKVRIPFLPGGWQKPDGRKASREEIMMILANVDNILIRLGYLDSTAREVDLINIALDSAGSSDHGLGSASLVEKCSCPSGYVGDSCESCASGYVRQPGGPWLGHCVPFVPEPCPSGTYGDPRRGVPCKECPCPHTGSNNFASGCQQSPDGDVVCRCNEGYTGRRCEQCAAGYQGNPLAPGGVCRRVPDTSCNVDGTYNIYSNGTCQCKDSVIGEQCDTCAAKSFHLNSFTYTGCIECFCSGVGSDCGSSTWYRDQVTSTFGRSRVNHGFALITDYMRVTPETVPVSTAAVPNALSFTGSAEQAGNTLYWSLPAPFLGNKLTSYGGKLSYTLSYSPLPSGIMSRNSAPDVVIKSGEDLRLIHYRKSQVSPSVPNTYSVEIKESAWQRGDEVIANREHVLMALSNITAIYIKATYTTSTKEASLRQVTLDTASPTNLGTARAVEVEQCRCLEGYLGLSCEQCAPGYTRDPEGGIYLGICRPCECNGHSKYCNSDTGDCESCSDNTEGPNCERCAPGYVGDATRGTIYDCQPDDNYSRPRPPAPGNQTFDCNVYCQPEGTYACRGNDCQCKRNVIGDRCDQCRPGTYGLSAKNPDGCKECYCSGLTSQCRSAPLYRQLIPVDFILSAPLITDDNGEVVDTENLTPDISNNMYTYSHLTYLPKYWSLRGSVLGNQLASYGGSLAYSLIVESYGHYERGQDLILIGNGLKLIWSRPDGNDDQEEFNVRLHEDEQWMRQDGGSALPATRSDFMTVLTDLQHILIRASPKVPTERTSIGNVILESSVSTRTPGATHASDIELCQCPSGYTGTSCESCAPLYYRDSSRTCSPCPCDAANTESCALGSGGYVECRCKARWKGDRCREIETNDPTLGPDTGIDDPVRTQIIVSIEKPEITIVPVGGSLTLSCTGRMRWSNSPVIVNWYKENSQLPADVDVEGGDLHLFNLQISDSGVYICQAVNNETTHVFKDTVSITISQINQRSPAQIIDLPSHVTFDEYVSNEIICQVRGNPAPVVTWARVDGLADAQSTQTYDNRLFFDSPRKSDEGRYRCQAENALSRDEKYVVVYVHSNSPQPPPPQDRLYITPEEVNGVAGESFQLVCQFTSGASLRYDWSHDGRPLSSSAYRNVQIRGNVLEVREATERDSGVYTCVAFDLRTRRNFTENAQVYIERRGEPPILGDKPKITSLEQNILIVQGQDYSITCEASGTPYPSIKWAKVHDNLADNAHISGNVLTIYEARLENRGVYTCVAENAHGSDLSSTSIDVEPRERPSLKIESAPQEPLTIGSPTSLYCSVEGIPTPTVEWVRVDGQPLSPRHKIEGPGYMVIEDIQIADSGDYECRAKNTVGEASAVANIVVHEPTLVQILPDTSSVRLTEGDELSLTCIASGFPNPTVYWIPPNRDRSVYSGPEPQGNRALLKIYQVTQAHAGIYTCSGNNEAGNDVRHVRVEVQQKRGDISEVDADSDSNNPYYPTQRPPVQQTGNNQRFSTDYGENVSLTCDIYPRVNTEWERVDGQPLPNNAHISGNKLNIVHVTQQNLGLYRCNGIGRDGNVESYVVRELVIVPLPRITFYPSIPLTVEVGQDLNVQCLVENVRQGDVYWSTDNNRPLPSSVHIDGNVLRFESITPAAAGEYRCSASNQYGNRSETARVVVKKPGGYTTVPQSQVQNKVEGESIMLQCSLTQYGQENHGNVQFQWFRDDGSALPHNAHPESQVLVLNHLRPEDAGRYICNSYDLDRRQQLPAVYIDLQVRPATPPPNIYLTPQLPGRRADYSLKLDEQSSSLQAGEGTSVECYSSDDTYTDVVWERADGAPLSDNIRQVGNRLVITNAASTDAGNYVCKCKTDEGDLYTTSYKLEVEDQPHELKSSKIVYAKVGANADLQCGADESRQPTYRWSRQYGQLQAGRSLLNEKLSLESVQANDAGTYICTAQYRDGETVDFPNILVVTGAIPQFRQEPRSYMSFPTLPNSSFKFNFELTFRPEIGDGLLLFNGQTRGSGDYIALSLKDRYAEFRFDFGGKPLLVRAEEPLALNEWHTVRVSRFKRDGYIQVDEQHPVAFPTLQQIPQLDLIEDLYIGGVPNWELLPAEAVSQQLGFVGCISRLTLQGRTVDLMRESKFKEGINDCRPCAQGPCQNKGVCLESQTEQAYTCVCQPGWTGRDCAIEGTQCTPGVCGAGRCENTENDMECLCPLNRSGDRCQYNEILNEQSLNFKGNSFAAYGTPKVTKVNITLSVRPSSLEDSVILYTAESTLPSGDYLALVLRGGHAELLINTAARLDPVVVRSAEPLPLNRWTRIEIRRRLGEGILRVGDGPERKAKAPGSDRILSLKTPLFVGGYDRSTVKVNRDVNITKGFDGCISRLYNFQKAIDLLADIKDAANIQSCGETNEVGGDEDGDNEPPVPPPSPEVHENEPYAMAPCASDPCENGGSCSEQEDIAICSCPFGFSGKFCQEHLQLGFNASFRGDGYVELNRSHFQSALEQSYTSIGIVFTTNKPNGLLFWWGQEAGEEYTGQDFIAAAVVDGYVEFSMRLDGEEAVIRNSDISVDNGERHIVIAKRDENTAMLEVDRMLHSGETRPTSKKSIKLPGNVFVGGVPDIAAFTGARYKYNLNGCIVVVEGETVGQINLSSAAVNGVNANVCPANDEPLGGTEPPVV
ncbi:basement membrane-specific heparan sulfate proteoglycan core protein isoform X4 [Drosophila eugracilis]|uniref:basement membrane-specific heparan sulfate proteoglycan core protein isoform X4 n=1 Tax=Drosophila eugracilis TaxID=29029 RepID=UPI0007E88A09|nr:basement membrane-specific heparan sulfate proteoglycan core protein isoform X4 [Drosophila eugracilis]